MSGVLLFAALSLATFRVWRFLARDDLTEFFWSHIPGKLGEGWRCGWCLGSWCAIASTYAVHVWLVRLSPHWGLWAAGVAAVVGFLAEIDRRLLDG